MGSEWPSPRLKDVCSKIGSGATPKGGSSVYQNDGEFALIRSQNVRNDAFDHNGLAFIESHHAEKLANVAVEERDVLLNITGDSVARCCQVDPSVLPARVNQHVAIVRPKPETLDPLYLRYYFVSPLMQNEMLSLAGVGATRNALTKGMIEDFEIPLPPLPEQKAIAHILGTLDDKIELNRRMNATLEGMAQALFKSWFVDFDPVIDNALAAGNPIPDELAPRAEVRKKALAKGTTQQGSLDHPTLSAPKSLFPAAFQFTEELGWIPEGWGSGQLGNIAKARGGYAFKSNCFLDTGHPVVKIKNLVGDGTVSLEHSQCISEETADTANRFILNDGDIVMAMTGATVGKSGVIVTNGSSVYLNQRVAKFESASEQRIEPFVFCYFRETKNYDYIVGTAGGSAQPNISSTQIESAPCIVPAPPVIKCFTDEVEFPQESGHGPDRSLC